MFQASTNKPSIGLGFLVIACCSLWKICQSFDLCAFIIIPIIQQISRVHNQSTFSFFSQNLWNLSYFLAIYHFSMNNALYMSTNKPSIGPVDLEIASWVFEKILSQFWLSYTHTTTGMQRINQWAQSHCRSL